MDCGKRLVDGARSISQSLEVTVVLDDEIGEPARAVGLDLGRDAGSYATFVELIPLDDSRDALLEWGGDDDRRIDKPIVPRFEEQRHDVNDDLPGLSVGFPLERDATYVRMKQRIEALAGRGIGEDHLCERDTVQHAVAHNLRPHSSDFHETVAVRSDDFTRDDVGVDDEGAEAREDRPYRILPSPDAAGQTNAQSPNL